jgi:hypothetical protein
MEEHNCEYISSRGILKSCDIQSSNPISSIHQLIDYDFSLLKEGSSIYICGSAIPHFINCIAPHINVNYILVSGDCDETVPIDLCQESDFNIFINTSSLIHWFSQNCILIHPKMTQLPIGLDYHTLSNNNHHPWGKQQNPLNQELTLKQIKSQSKPLDKRIIKAYANFHFFMTSKYGYDRKEAIQAIPKELVYYEPTPVERNTTWKEQSKYAFVISPHGNGLDCHRTWEAIALGCIPIVKTSPLNSLFEDLPVLIVNSWTDVTQDLLNQTIHKKFKLEKMKLQYWMDKINQKI